MVIDCHTHINSPGSQFSTDDHFTAAESLDACVVLACPAESNRQSNELVARYVAKHQKKMFGFAVVNPVKDDISKKYWSDTLDDLNLKGVALYCSSEGFHPAHSRALQFYEVAEDLKIPLFFHSAPPFTFDAVLEYARPSLLDEIAQKFKGLKIVIGSMGQPFVNETVCMLAKHENVFGDLTINPQNVWEVYNTVLAAHEAGVLDKLFFGSGLPLRKPQGCIETLLGFNRLFADTNLPTVPREKIREIIERDSLAILGIEHALST
ncbi:MAG: amidohydrolase family protein [Sedimentisphaerales bacterium]